MPNYFVGQSYPKIVVDTNFDISTATELRILYKKPSGKKGFWPGTLNGTDAIEYEFEDGDIDQAGKWELQAFAVVDGKNAYGNVVAINVGTPIQQQIDC